MRAAQPAFCWQICKFRESFNEAKQGQASKQQWNLELRNALISSLFVMCAAMRFQMRLGISVALLVVAASFPLVSAAHGQTFEDRWGLVPKANAAEPPPAGEPQSAPYNKEQPHQENQSPTYSPPEQPSAQAPATVLVGKASFYAYRRGKTASGAPYDRNALTAASRTLPFGTKVRVTDVKTNKSVDVTVTDRGPASKHLILDLSLGAAHALGIGNRGIIEVRAEIIG
jgi:rare lipoprotein A